jgi:hypothetical protein
MRLRALALLPLHRVIAQLIPATDQTAHDDALQPLLTRRIINGSSQLIGHSSNHYHQIESAFNLQIEAAAQQKDTRR